MRRYGQCLSPRGFLFSFSYHQGDPQAPFGSDTGSGLAALCSLLRKQEFPHGCTSATHCLCCGATPLTHHTQGCHWQSKTEVKPLPLPLLVLQGNQGQRREWDNTFVTSTARKISKGSQRGSGKHHTALLRMGLNWTEASNKLFVVVNTAGRIKHMAWDKRLQTSSMNIQPTASSKKPTDQQFPQPPEAFGAISCSLCSSQLQGCCAVRPHLISEHAWVTGQCCPMNWCNRWKALRKNKLPLGAINEPNPQDFNKYIAVLLHIKLCLFQLKPPLRALLNPKC